MGVIFLFWMPLAYLGQLAARGYWASRLGETDPAEVAEAYDRLEGGARLELQAVLAGVPAMAFLIAALVGGLVVGRFDEGSGVRDATWAGALVAVVAAILAVVTPSPVGTGPAFVLAMAGVSLLGAGAARLGAWLGRRRGEER